MKRNVISTILLMGVGMLIVGIYTREREQWTETFNYKMQTEAELKDEAIIALFIEDIVTIQSHANFQ